MENTIKINKTELKKISFTEKEVLDQPNQKERSNLLNAAIRKKKDGTGKVGITFKTKNRGSFKVATAILTAGEDFLVIKGGQTIPIKSITKISL
jgi:hypothetical protein